MCLCDAGYVGDSCDVALCPDDCNSKKGHGSCHQPSVTNTNPNPEMFCYCNDGYFGDRCSLHVPVKSTSGTCVF